MTAACRCAAPGTKEAASPPLTFDENAAARQAGGRAARGYGAAPPASRLLRIAGATALRAAWTPETSAAPQAGSTGRPSLPPPSSAARPMGPCPWVQRTPGTI